METLAGFKWGLLLRMKELLPIGAGERACCRNSIKLGGLTSLNVENIGLDAAVADQTMLAAMQNPLAAFRCPSDIAPDLNTDQKVPSGAAGNDDCTDATCHALATSNYVAANDSDNLEADDWNGVFGKVNASAGSTNCTARCTRLRDVPDGTSNTIAIGERTWKLEGTSRQAAVVFGTNGDDDNDNNQGSNYVLATGGRIINDICNTCDRGFSRQHTGGAQFLIADGAMQFISENLNHDVSNGAINTVLASLATRIVACSLRLFRRRFRGFDFALVIV